MIILALVSRISDFSFLLKTDIKEDKVTSFISYHALKGKKAIQVQDVFYI